MYSNLKKGLVVGVVAGFIAATLVFSVCCWGATLPAISEVSLTWAVRPWWRPSNWLVALYAFAFVGFVFGVLAAFRPDSRKKR
jgi:ABC-type antimicrobial peptide transport system permease subunit